MTHGDPSIPLAAPTSSGRPILRATLLIIGLLVIGGTMAGLLAAHRQDGGGSMSVAMIAILGVCATLVAGGTVLVGRDLLSINRRLSALPSSERASLRMLGIALLAGFAVGGGSVMMSTGTSWLTGPPGGLPAWVAILSAAALLTVGPYFTRRWWAAIDEHERSAYFEGAYAGGHFALYVGLAWIMLHRADLVPRPDMFALLMGMSLVWTGVWLYRKFT